MFKAFFKAGASLIIAAAIFIAGLLVGTGIIGGAEKWLSLLF